MIKYTTKLGLTCIEPDEGKILERNGVTYKKLLLSKNDNASNYNEIIDEDYVFESEDDVVESPELDDEKDISELKKQLIKLSKYKLSNYLEEHPLFSDIKHKEGKYYNVTKLDQLISQLILYQNNINAGLEYQLTWNATGEVSEPWTYEELLQLSNQIDSYTKPLVNRQREIEVEINNANNISELSKINISFE